MDYGVGPKRLEIDYFCKGFAIVTDTGIKHEFKMVLFYEHFHKEIAEISRTI